MTLLSLVAGVLAAGLSAVPAEPPQVAAASSHGSFRWVRGSVTAVSPDSLILKLRNKSLTLTLDPATQVFRPGGAAASVSGGLPVVGSVVEAHYVEHRQVRRAAMIYEQGGGSSNELSKRPGTSYRGLANGLSRNTLKVRIDSKSRGVKVDAKTRLTDSDGRALAVGRKPIGALLAAGEEVLVTYANDSDDIIAGDVMIFGSTQRALEIRKLRP
jgi:hypothetical protein